MAKLQTPRCTFCGESGYVELSDEELADVVENVKFIQDALPSRDASFREQVMTGIHPACWDRIFKDEED